MTMGLLLVASAYAVPSAFDDARRMLTSILEEKNGDPPSLCWEADGNDAVVLTVVAPDGTREPVAGPRGPTLNDTLAMLPEESPWYGVDPLTVEQCPAAAVVG